MRIFLALALLISTGIFGQDKKLTSGEINFHAIEKREVQAVNKDFSSKINLSTGNIEFKVPMDNFKFKTPLMKKHFNSQENINVAQFPYAFFVGKITTNTDITKEGRHIVTVKGKMTIKGISHPFEAKGLLINKNGTSIITSSFLIDGTQYGLTSDKVKKFADQIEVSLQGEYL